MLWLACGLQIVLTLPPARGPVRVGVPLPAESVADGLRLRGPGQLQWRRLPVGDAGSDPVWVEVVVVGADRRAAVIERGGRGPQSGRSGEALVWTRETRPVASGRESVTRWAFADGTVDECRRLMLTSGARIGGEDYAGGEALATWRAAPGARAVASCALPRRLWVAAGVLPSPFRRPGPARVVRRRLGALQPALIELPGARGAGDYGRSGGTITNNEFDTALGFLRLALATGDRDAFLRGVRCAHHLRDRDLDTDTGLPFPHGPGHRTGVPMPGHTWLQGPLLAGLLTADDDLIDMARSIGQAVAARPPIGRGRRERARDFAWPLLELEALLAVDPDPVLAHAADRLARAIAARFDADCRTFRFGEGEVGSGYLERAWLTGGLVLPALRAHLARRRDLDLAEQVRAVELALLEQLDRARKGLPTHWRVHAGKVFAVHRVEADVRGLFLLEGLAPAELSRLLRREELRALAAELPSEDDPDLPTAFSMLARCSWVYR